jgi:hypothetical protein
MAKIEVHVFSREDAAGIGWETIENELEIAGIGGNAPGWLDTEYRSIFNSRQVGKGTGDQRSEVATQYSDRHCLEGSPASILRNQTSASTFSWLPAREKSAVGQFKRMMGTQDKGFASQKSTPMGMASEVRTGLSCSDELCSTDDCDRSHLRNSSTLL